MGSIQSRGFRIEVIPNSTKNIPKTSKNRSTIFPKPSTWRSEGALGPSLAHFWAQGGPEIDFWSILGGLGNKQGYPEIDWPSIPQGTVHFLEKLRCGPWAVVSLRFLTCPDLSNTWGSILHPRGKCKYAFALYYYYHYYYYNYYYSSIISNFKNIAGCCQVLRRLTHWGASALQRCLGGFWRHLCGPQRSFAASSCLLLALCPGVLSCPLPGCFQLKFTYLIYIYI